MTAATTIEGHKAALQRVHAEVMGRNADSKTLNYWANCLANNLKALADFEASLLNGAEYRQHLAKAFKEAYYDHVGADVQAADVEAFVDAHAGRRVDGAQLFACVSRLPQFEDKYVKLIGSVYSLHKSQPCALDVVQHYLRKLRADAGYDVGRLTADIQADAHLRGPEEGPAEEAAEGAGDGGDAPPAGAGASYVRAFLRAHGREPTEEDFLQQQRAEQELALERERGGAGVDLALTRPLVAELDRALGRPTYVHEYHKYVLDRGHAAYVRDRHAACPEAAVAELLPEEALDAIAADHRASYNRLRDIYASYTGCELAEYDYVARFLYAVDDPAFFDSVVDGIVGSRDYELGMRRLLQAKYAAMHDERLEDEDAGYLFRVVRQRRLGMDSDMLERILQAFKQETDEITQHVFQQYVDVLERQPDMYEVERDVAFYRERLPAPLCTDGIGAIDEQLEAKLMRSLEYMDTVKNRIRALVRARQGRDVLPSVLFDTLQRVLAEVGSFRAADLGATIVRVAGLPPAAEAA